MNKPNVLIQKFIGRRPIAAFGNSDGDLEMLRWTAAGSGARLALLVHHNDAIREFAYDRSPSIGQLDKALDKANAKGWTVVDMKNDWQRVFPSEWASGEEHFPRILDSRISRLSLRGVAPKVGCGLKHGPDDSTGGRNKTRPSSPFDLVPHAGT
jgi:hypothetical protein